jgi:phosphate transport system permease protein
MHQQSSTNLQQFARTRGEVYVWLTSMGLVVGLVMILFLLGLIVVQGFRAFWPKQVTEITFQPGVEVRGSETGRITGEIVQAQERRDGSLHQGRPELEFQLRTANRDTYGASFRWVPESAVAEKSQPPGLLEIERMEFGNAIGFPVQISLDGGTKILPAQSPDFLPALRQAVREAAERRAEILHIERTQIGRINARMNQLRNRERALGRDGLLTPAFQQETEAALAGWQKEFEVLAARARALRAAQEADVLTIRLASGQETSVAAGNIVHFFFPNDLGSAGRLSLFAHNFWAFLSQNPREANMEGGIFPAIFGTAVMTLLMSIAVMPFGVVAAIYLREYARQGLMVRSVRIAVNNLAGVPSIVFGVFGLGFFVYLAGGTLDQLFFSDTLPTPTFGTGGIFWASLTLALMTVPVVIVATEESLAAVPRGVREGSLACGASKWQTIERVVLPAAAPGILTGLILAMARGAGEVAPLMLVGVVKLAPTLPIDGEFPFVHLERKFMHLGFHIFDLGFQSPDAEAAKPMVFATTLLLILLVVVLNLAAIIIREHLRKKYATAAF